MAKQGEKMERNTKMERITKIVDLVDYQDEAVVSKTILDKKSGTVTLFAFDEGQGLSEHTTPFDALVQIVDGEAKIVISDEVLSFCWRNAHYASQ